MNDAMPVADDNALLHVVAQELNGGALNASLKSFHMRQKAAALIDAIEAAGFVIRRIYVDFCSDQQTPKLRT